MANTHSVPGPAGDPLDLVLSKLEGVTRHGDHWTARCPLTASHANGDAHPSLDIRRGDTQPVVVICRSQNCPGDDIIAALGLTWGQLCEPSQNGTGLAYYGDPVTVAYDYHDENSGVLFQVCRTLGKQF